MSAIYGAIGLKTSDVQTYSERFKKYYDQYKIDRNEQIVTESAFFGCGIQYFNKEAEGEKLPLYDKERNILFTADCVIDNREELIKEFDLDSETPDGTLLYRAYLKWGENSFDHLRGPFSFAAYNIDKGEVILATDHFAQRCLFYHVRNGILYFSTLFFPLLRETNLEFEENERWLIDSASVRGPVMITEPRETAMRGIYKVVSGRFIKIGLNSMEDNQVGEETTYYNPAKTIKIDKSITKEKSEALIREVMERNIGRIIRKDITIGAQLSRGLDSSAVACQAAKLLDKEGRKLYSYTSIPLKEANLESKGYIVYDESEGVKKIVEAYPNIIPTFTDTKGRNYILEAEDIISIWEMPCKSQQNAIWIDEINKLAGERGCRILFGGSTGNCTISAGSIESTILEHVKHLRFYKAYRTMDAVVKVGASRKRYIKTILGLYKKYYAWYFNKEDRDCYKYIFTKRQVGEKYNLTKRFHKDIYHFKPIYDKKEMHRQMYMVNANAQIGEIDTKKSLLYGVIARDPMRTVELVNLCFSLPIECFASNDYDRRLVRVGMKGIVPEEIRHDVAHRGRQSGDNTFRAKQVMEEFKKSLIASLEKGYCDKYLSTEEVRKCLFDLGKEPENEEDEILRLIDTYSFSKYLELLHKN